MRYTWLLLLLIGLEVHGQDKHAAIDDLVRRTIQRSASFPYNEGLHITSYGLAKLEVTKKGIHITMLYKSHPLLDLGTDRSCIRNLGKCLTGLLPVGYSVLIPVYFQAADEKIENDLSVDLAGKGQAACMDESKNKMRVMKGLNFVGYRKTLCTLRVMEGTAVRIADSCRYNY